MSSTTLFMSAANPKAVLVTRTGKTMRRRTLEFSDAHAALDWCQDRRATFVLMPGIPGPKLN
jgi:hypothetical protein